MSCCRSSRTSPCRSIPERTPDDFLLDAVRTVFACGKPHFVNHPMMVGDLGERYAAVSCYNSLPIGGGSHTLVRLNLLEVGRQHDGPLESFFDDTLPHYVELTCELIEARIRYLVEEARFFEHSWLVHEGLLASTGSRRCSASSAWPRRSNLLMEREATPGTYGHDDGGQRTSYLVTGTVARLRGRSADAVLRGQRRAVLPPRPVGHRHRRRRDRRDPDPDRRRAAAVATPAPPSPRTTGSSRRGSATSSTSTTPRAATPRPSSTSSAAAFAHGMRDVTFNLDSNDFIRITGYLVRKSDLERIDEGARHASTFLGAGSEHEAALLRAARSSGW